MPALSLLRIFRHVFGEPSSETKAENRMRRLLIDTFAQHLIQLAAGKPRSLNREFERYPEFQIGVLRRRIELVAEESGVDPNAAPDAPLPDRESSVGSSMEGTESESGSESDSSEDESPQEVEVIEID
ncbi:hypothetical protein EJ08DRAFT_647937 [Tothia fuscella]|uniref:Uncharacterized protein n=1 Tax=Tothia fuscella TaxID=1048955 RepID=A0A9P4NWD1_9PEZI|nr:hypothetical protein EJ08DRAFT_647937 [Tothia fuscella]